MKFNRKTFFDSFKKEFGPLEQKQVAGLEFLLTAMEADEHVSDVRHFAYMLATTKHETADTFHPIHEFGSRKYFTGRYGGQTALGRRLGNDTPEEGALYAGVGDVQLTGESNFERAEIELRTQYPDVVADFEARAGRKFDLTVGDQPDDELDPQNAGDPIIAYCIMSAGMRQGWFTGKRLAHFINARQCDYFNARRIINGLDKAKLIASYAVRFERILEAALEHEESAPEPIRVSSRIQPTPATEGTPAAPVAAPVVNVEQKNVESTPSPIVKTASEQVTLIASSGLTRLAKRLSTGTLSTGALATITAFAERNWILLAFASLLIVAGFVTFLVIYRSKHKEKLVEADIRSDASRFNVSFQK
jgi:putative chitinase